MKWVTHREACEAANTRKGAIACSSRKWKQLSTATQIAILTLGENETPCALCKRYYLQQQHCPLIRARCGEDNIDCCAEWRVAHRTRIEWRLVSTLANFRQWRKAARAMLARLGAIK